MKAFEEGLFAAVELGVEYCRRLDAGERPSIDDINALQDAVSTFSSRVDYKRPDIAKALERAATYNPRDYAVIAK